MIAWRMLVWAPDGTARATIDVDDHVVRLTRFDVDPIGCSLEAEFQAVPSQVDIRARDTIRLDVSTDGGATATLLYKGVIVVAGAARATDLRTFKAVGLKQRFYETINTAPVIDGDDVRNMADAASSGHGIEGVTVFVGVSTSFELGDRYPALEPIGATLDALAASVGRFIVPPGETYIYFGIVFSAGDIVPAVRWGVLSSGALTFKRPTSLPLAISEGDDGVDVLWSDVVAEEIADRVTLVYASGYDPRPVAAYWQTWDATETSITARTKVPAAEGIPVSHAYDSGGDYDADRLVPLDHPLDAMTRFVSSDARAQGVDSGDVPNIFDGDPTTSATFLSGIPDGSGRIQILDVPQEGGILLLDMELGGNTTELWLSQRFNSEDGTGGVVVARVAFAIDAHQGERTITSIPLLLPPFLAEPNDPPVGGATYHVFLEGFSEGDTVYRVDVNLVDGETGDRLAQGYLRSPEANAAEVRLHGQLGPVTHAITLTPLGEAAVEVPVERITYALTREGGLQTIYHLGQEYTAEEMSESVVLERLAQRAVKERS